MFNATTLEQLATQLVGDGKLPNLYFLSSQNGNILAVLNLSEHGTAAQEYAIRSAQTLGAYMIEDRLTGVVWSQRVETAEEGIPCPYDIALAKKKEERTFTVSNLNVRISMPADTKLPFAVWRDVVQHCWKSQEHGISGSHEVTFYFTSETALEKACRVLEGALFTRVQK